MRSARHRANVLLWHARQLPRRLARLGDRVLGAIAPSTAFAGLAILALAERPRTTWRRLRGAKPRLVWGPAANLGIKYLSAAMRSQGFESATCVDVDASITKQDDFDVHRDELIERRRLPGPLRQYALFIWALRHGDVFLMFFDGGFLRSTPLCWREYGLIRLAGKKLVFSPYGGDIAVPGHLEYIEEAMLADYPQLIEQGELIRRRVLYACRWADVSVRNLQPGFQPFFNALWGNQLGIDAAAWNGGPGASTADGSDAEVTVVHAPNHRALKGTEHLERAVTELRGEGLSIDLRILERRPNLEVRAAVLAADIVADQFLFGYGLFAVEGMAASKPVLANLNHLAPVFRDSEQMRACPIVNTSPEALADDLRRLVVDPVFRGERGRAGREFVLRHHSYDAVGRNWAAIIDRAWLREPLPARLRPDQASPAS